MATRIIEDAIDGLQLACARISMEAIDAAARSMRSDQGDTAKAIVVLLRQAGLNDWPVGKLVCDLVKAADPGLDRRGIRRARRRP